jgi:hypothetical protein
MGKTEEGDEHEKFKEFCALAQCNALTLHEQIALDRHLKICESCRYVYEEYSAVSEQGMASLLAEDDLAPEASRWDNRATRDKLMHSVVRTWRNRVWPIDGGGSRRVSRSVRILSRKVLALGSLAACAIIAVTVGGYRLGERAGAVVLQPVVEPAPKTQAVKTEKAESPGILAGQADQILRLERKIASQQEQLAQLRDASSAAEQRANELEGATGEKDARLQQLSAQRDELANRLAEGEKAYQVLKSDYSTLRAEYDRHLLEFASMESNLKLLQTKDQDQERKLRDEGEYLAEDRDIRELMGARKLYIADVFDVDSESRTRKPFGRVFYTQSKSLVFYAYDLENQPGVQNTSVFQVWGERDAESNGASKAMNLGILYMDSESNRRWVLRSDAPKQLAEIDAVFVTVEPHGGSQKPTGKPLLYALLRKEANHP